MGVDKPKSRFSAFIARACRLPREVACKVSDMSDSISRERLKEIQLQNNFPYRYLSVAILLLLYFPWMLSFNYVIPPQVELISGSEVDTEPYCNVISFPEIGVTQAQLLNTTPFSLNGDWEVEHDYYWRKYDFNRYGYTDSDGYHFTSTQLDYSIISFERRLLIPIHNYTELTASAVFEGISGSAGVYFEVFVDNVWSVFEADIAQGNTTKVNATAPLEEAKSESTSWLSSVRFRLQIGLAEGAHVILRGIEIDTVFTGKMSRVQFDIKNTENHSLFENPFLKFADYAPRFLIVQNNNINSARYHFPCRADDEIYLPAGMYEGVVYWNLDNQETPDPTNSSLWTPNVSFNVTDDIALDINVGLFAKRIDFDISPSVLVRSLSIFFLDYFQYGESTEIVGSTVYTLSPDYLYIPGEINSFSIWMNTWSWTDSRTGWGSRTTEQFHIQKDITYTMTNNSMNLLVSVTLPYAPIGNALFGLGTFVIFSLVVLLIAGFVISIHRYLQYTNLRNRLSDSRILPLILLSASVFLPWSIQIAKSSTLGFDALSWVSWFSMPFMIRWSDSTGIELLVSASDWWPATVYSTIFLFIPLFYGYLSLSSIEPEEFNQQFGLALFLPYLHVLAGFNFSVLTLETISLGPLVAIAALPVWLLRLGLRRLKITT